MAETVMQLVKIYKDYPRVFIHLDVSETVKISGYHFSDIKKSTSILLLESILHYNGHIFL